MAEKFDIAVIGAGPAGLCATRSILLQHSGCSVVLIEKNNRVDKRIPCAEGVGRLGFHEIMPPRPSWIRSVVHSAAFHSPDNTVITYTDKEKGYIVNRALMQHDLVEWCQEHGATGLFDHTVSDVSVVNKKGLRVVSLDNAHTVTARVVVDCSGPFSRFGKYENLEWKPLDLETAYFAYISGITATTDTIHIYVGQSIAPGGYAWAFPRDEKSYNVGIVTGNTFRGKINPRKLLESFIKTHFPQAGIQKSSGGVIPCFKKRLTAAAPGLIKAGDAVSTVNPISRAGISEAMKSGTLAGTFALKMLEIETDRDMKHLCKQYENEWYKKLGKKHSKLAHVKNSLLNVTDSDYNRGAHTLVEVPHDHLTMSRIFMVCLGKFPKLVWALRHLM